MPSAICYEQVTPGEWREHFCLVNPTQFFDDEDDASSRAESDLNEASALRAAGGSDADLAMSLKTKGYVRLDDFRRAKD